MTRYLIDTNVLLRLLDFSSTHHLAAKNAVAKLLAQNDVVCVTTQNLIEFWSVATRLTNVNGLDWDTQKQSRK